MCVWSISVGTNLYPFINVLTFLFSGSWDNMRVLLLAETHYPVGPAFWPSTRLVFFHSFIFISPWWDRAMSSLSPPPAPMKGAFGFPECNGLWEKPQIELSQSQLAWKKVSRIPGAYVCLQDCTFRLQVKWPLFLLHRPNYYGWPNMICTDWSVWIIK